MGFDTNGNWTSDFYPETDRDEGIAILASKFQQLIQTDIKGGFDNCLTRDGAGKPNANLNFNGYKITNLANAETPNDALTLEQAQAGTSNYANDTSNTANAITISLDPAISSYTLGQRFYFKVANTNTLSEVSFNANSLGLCRVQMDGSDNLVAGSLKQNCIYEGVYSETGNTAEATYAGRRLQVLSQASDLASTLNHKQITNCILSAPNGVATQDGLLITLKSEVRFLIYHGLNADNTIDNIDYTTTTDTTYTFAGTETDGTYYLFANDSGVITPSLNSARQTDKVIFAECVISSGTISSFTAYNPIELVSYETAKNMTMIKTTYWSGSQGSTLTLPTPIPIEDRLLYVRYKVNTSPNRTYVDVVPLSVIQNGDYIGQIRRGGENADRDYDNVAQITISDGYLTVLTPNSQGMTFLEIGVIS